MVKGMPRDNQKVPGEDALEIHTLASHRVFFPLILSTICFQLILLFEELLTTG